MPALGLASPDEIRAAKHMFGSINDLADALGTFLTNSGDQYEHRVLLEHLEELDELQQRLDASGVSRADMKRIVADAYMFFVEMTECVAMHAEAVAREAEAALIPNRD